MSAGWVAGSVRARALVRRRLGSGRARMLAASDSLTDALTTLAATPYGHDVSKADTLSAAQRSVAATYLWHLRVLAGWLPRDGVELARTAAAWFEIANVDELLHGFGGDGAREPPYRLGALATAWSRLAACRTPAELRGGLAASAWADPGGAEPRTIRLSMRLSWLARIAGAAGDRGAAADRAAAWAAGAAALLVAGERFGAGRDIPASLRPIAAALIGPRAMSATTLPELRAGLAAGARWPLAGIDDAARLWRAEARWWGRVERDAEALLGRSGFGAAPVLGAVASLAVDAWRVRAALEMAARGGTPIGGYDAIA
ncbi:MAG TPA: hypothetical protein VFU43_28850 [Streptosporangiaceae bacterium]|nr:hypothetical protein [Streptosporangiaceae bacterium]